MPGYLSQEYAESFAELGSPVKLESSGGWVIRRRVPLDAGGYDVMGPYPLLCVSDWSRLGDDLRELGRHAVALSAVLDPLGGFEPEKLAAHFPDVFFPFKTHFVADLQGDWRGSVHADHLRKARRALGKVRIGEVVPPSSELDRWCELYGVLVARHAIKGISAFSREAFRHHLAVPGLSVFAAWHDQAIVGMLLWYRQGELAYYHLGAYSDEGYKLGASFALFNESLSRLKELGVRWADLGGGAGLAVGGDDGLARFKKGWAKTERVAYFAGRVFDKPRYEKLKTEAGVGETNYFPAYRAPRL